MDNSFKAGRKLILGTSEKAVTTRVFFIKIHSINQTIPFLKHPG